MKRKDATACSTKLALGPGGYDCSCCNRMRWLKKETRRIFRRTEKLMLRKEVATV